MIRAMQCLLVSFLVTMISIVVTANIDIEIRAQKAPSTEDTSNIVEQAKHTLDPRSENVPEDLVNRDQMWLEELLIKNETPEPHEVWDSRNRAAMPIVLIIWAASMMTFLIVISAHVRPSLSELAVVVFPVLFAFLGLFSVAQFVSILFILVSVRALYSAFRFTRSK